MGIAIEKMLHNVFCNRLHSHNALASSLLEFVCCRVNALYIPSLRKRKYGFFLGNKVFFCYLSNALHLNLGFSFVSKGLARLGKLVLDDPVNSLWRRQNGRKLFYLCLYFF